MAELLGVVASGIAVTQAADLLGALVVSLSRLWREVRDVPDSIRQVVEDLELVASLVGVIETELALPSSGLALGSDSLTSLQCLTIQRCRQAHKDLGDVVGDLRADIASARKRRRLFAGVKVVLRKDTLESYERRLQKALSVLGLVVQMHTVSLSRQQPALTAARVIEDLTLSGVLTTPSSTASEASSEEEVDNNEKETRICARKRRVVRSREKYRYSNSLLRCFGVEFCKVEERTADKDASQSISYRLRVAPHQWFLGKTWDIQITTMAYSGWKTFFRQYVFVPDGAEVFGVLAYGTWEKLMRLFDEGRASPFSVGYAGMTLVHFAMVYRFEFVEPLLRMGLDFHQEDSIGRPAYVLDRGDVREHTSAVHRLALSQGVYDEVVEWRTHWVARHMLWNVETFDWFLVNIFPDFYQWPLERRLWMLECAVETALDHKLASRVFRPHGGFHSDDLHHRLPSCEQTVLRRFYNAYFWASRPVTWFGTARVNKDRHQWDQLRLVVRDIAAIIDYADLSDIEEKTGITAFLRGVTKFVRDLMASWRSRPEASNTRNHRLWRRNIQKLVRAWLEDLQAGGKDLEVYGETELAVFVRLERGGSAPWSREILQNRDKDYDFRETGYKWKGFTVGPRPEDWAMVWEWDPYVDMFVGEFWAGIEDPLLVVPGSWVDDAKREYMWKAPKADEEDEKKWTGYWNNHWNRYWHWYWYWWKASRDTY